MEDKNEKENSCFTGHALSGPCRRSSHCLRFRPKTGAEEGSGEDNKLYVYNWGEYIDESVIDEFEEETGIEVVYDLLKQMKKCIPS